MRGHHHVVNKSRKHFLRLAVAACALLLWGLWFAGCSAETSAVAAPETTGWFATADGLAAAVAKAVSAHDRTALDRFRITRKEYLAIVWPELPISKVEQWKDQSGFVWSQHAAKSDAGLRKVLRRYGGTPLRVRTVRFGATEHYGELKIHVKPELLLHNGSAAVPALRLMGSMIEKAGRYKVFSYNIET